jgi:ribonuclease III
MGSLDRLLSHIGTWFRSTDNQSFPEVDFRKLELTLHHRIQNKQYFFEALSHRSYLQVPQSPAVVSNERMEFLGDAILNLVVAEYLFRRHTSAAEGDLTKVRSRLVNRKALFAYANEMHLSEFILMSTNASQLGGKGMETMLSDAFEAIIGAIYLDGGYESARMFTERLISSAMERGLVSVGDENFKSRLLEYSQGKGFGVPRYVTLNEEGPDHDRVFTIEVSVGGTPLGVGTGKNKKDAEQQAAEKALQQLHLL